MKKILLSIMMLFPICIEAYSEYLIPGGENIGIQISTDGLTIVGFYKVNGKYIASENLKVGDTIIKIENEKINDINEMSNLIDKNIKNNEINITIIRDNKELNEKLELVNEDGIYKTGLYIKDKVTGIGTLTYIDPESKIYGSLGHRIVMNETNNNIEIKDGNLYNSTVSSVDRSIDGRVGSKNAYIDYNNILGTINKNTDVGIFGNYKNIIPKKGYLKVAKEDDIKLGKAYIYTTINENEIEKYEIEITNIYKEDFNTNKSFSFKVTDEKLLENTGGIVQGMSGSPIIQNNLIIGAVTHVVVDEVDKGYGVFIRTMLREGER